MTDMRSLVATWWDNLDDADQQRVRDSRSRGLPADIASSLTKAGILTVHMEWVNAPNSERTPLPEPVREYLDELDRDDEQG